MTDPSPDSGPTDNTFLPYGRQSVDETDIQAVVEALRSDWLTTGPKVKEFEEQFAETVGAKHAVALANGTAALHATMAALEVGPGDEVIVPAMTFAATANAVVFEGGRPVFCDVDPDTLLIDVEQVDRLVTPKTRAVVSVDYAGHPCDYDLLHEVADRHGLSLVADACHAVGAEYKGRAVGSLADLSAFSFHPVKNMTTGEGGMVTTDDESLAESMRRFRNHGISRDHHARKKQKTHRYEMVDLGYNYRLSEFQCALGINQLSRLSAFLDKRREIASLYSKLLQDVPGIEPLHVVSWANHAYHLYVVEVRIDRDDLRDELYSALHKEGIGVNVHYLPVHLHPFYRRNLDTHPGLCPNAEAAYHRILSLPIHPAMKLGDVERVTNALKGALDRLTHRTPS